MMSDAQSIKEAPTKTLHTEDVAPEDVEWINGFPVPPSSPTRPFHAVASVFKLMRNKEDTRQVFEIIRALSGRSSRRLFERFTASDYGLRVVTAQVRLEDVLSDHEALRAMTPGSFGRAYLDFMEGENLTADGLLDSAEEAGLDLRTETEFEEFRRAFLHIDVCHDLWHVLTGYGRDSLGELCNLVYTRQQTGNVGFRLIVMIGFLAQKLEQPFQPIQKALAEAGRNARAANWVLEYDVEELLPLQITEARRRLGLAEPTIYKAIPGDIKNNLLKPKVTMTQSQREKARHEGAGDHRHA